MATAMGHGTEKFTAVDIVTLGILLAIPPLIGIYFAIKDKNVNATKSYFFGGKKMNPIAIGISTAVTTISAITMIGTPSEVYIVGTAFFWSALGMIVAVVIQCVYYVPFYSNLQLDTVYMYLGLRFNAVVQRMVAGMVMINEIVYMGTVIYVPSLALNAVTSIPIVWSIAVIGGVCTFYTTLGGMKAVVWSDVVQSTLMIAASLAVLFIGVNAVGGLSEVTSALSRGERETFIKFEAYDISSRSHPVASIVGGLFAFNQYYACSQLIYQRIMSCKNTQQSQISIVAFFFPALLIFTVSVANGLILYAYFEGCDPVKNHDIQRGDQILPFMALLEFSKFPGVAGAFIAAIFSGSLSTLSSGLNGYGIVIVEDFCPIFFPNMRQKTKVFIGKMTALILGVCVTLTAWAISQVESNVFKIWRMLSGGSSGSIFGIYLLGIFTPWTNSWGAICGGAAGYALMIWIFYGANFVLDRPPRVPLPPTSVEACPVENNTVINVTTTLYGQEIFTTPRSNPATNDEYSITETIFSINFNYYLAIGCLASITVGLLVSFISGHQKAKDANPRLFMPLLDNHRFPRKVVKYFRLGVPHEKLALQDDGECTSLEKENLSSQKRENTVTPQVMQLKNCQDFKHKKPLML